MRILYHHRTQGGGVERVHILGFVNAWTKQGHEVDIVSPPGVKIAENEAKERGGTRASSPWKAFSRKIPQFFFEIFELVYNAWALFALSRRVRSKKIELIYERYAFLCCAGALVALFHRIPLLLEVNFTTETPLVRSRTTLVRLMDRTIEKFVFRRASGLIVVSTWLKTRLVKSGVTPNKILVVPNAADPDKFFPSKPDHRLLRSMGIEGKKIIGFVGFFYKWHGIDLLLDAFMRISKLRDDIVCVLVGDGPAMAETRDKVSRDGLERKVVFVGHVPYEEIPGYVALFDLAVMPHSNAYGSPMKIPEYMAAGKAVVAPRLEPIEDIVRDAETGLLFQPGDTDDLARKMMILVDQEDLREKMAQDARKYIVNTHNWYINGKKILDYFAGAEIRGEA
ncbi:MAG TPA: glycosyltransferase family 4 protein [Syntrophorhabdaceae bacterium]|nr:glycosyltransferase family 4 protein [Syntrophorhabdaceae bacterium]